MYVYTIYIFVLQKNKLHSESELTKEKSQYFYTIWTAEQQIKDIKTGWVHLGTLFIGRFCKEK